MKRTAKILIGTIIIISILLSLGILLIEPIKSLIRQNIIDDSMDIIESQISQISEETNKNISITIQVPDTDMLSVVGEDEEDEGNLDELLEDINNLNSKYTTLTCIGILEVPDIEIKEPIWDSCSKVALRYGVGRYPLSANLGTEGNTTILGHRNKHISTIFYRLQSIKKGTEVIVTTPDGIQHRYEVFKIKNVSPNNLDENIIEKASKAEQLTLVTCATELGKGYRFLAICKPIQEPTTELKGDNT